MRKHFVCVLLLCLINAVQLNPAAEAFLWNELVPDILTNTPTRWLSVRFPSGVKSQLGNSLSLQDVVQEPKLNWEVVAGTFYTVLFVDPDALSRETAEYRSFLHWLVVNVPGTNIDAGEIIAPFLKPQPPAGSGPHRYVFLIYEQPGCEKFEGFSDFTDQTNRRSFSVEDFTKKYKLGKPLAGNFYYAQNSIPKAVLAFVENGVVPDVLETPPVALLEVIFPSGALVQAGDEILLDQVVQQPQLHWDANPGRFYTILFIDPDVSSRENAEYRSYLHWLVVNVPGNDINSGDTLAYYINPKPRPGTGLHRYVFLVYEQPDWISFDGLPDYTDLIKRTKFSPEVFSKRYNLGTLIAGNLYQSKNYDIVV
ncbi:hypothetical protein K1T71_011133 [Dendrolimus kikuchii]|uniref:Uncharacterized protein n=1 Tax=Dendrolimus kikuchii TaxID=765133 RepID=A0ACC1CN97_9NEOP|nr:hypothetical protein K1T71_011133 [Dendrolimus kikuchii]